MRLARFQVFDAALWSGFVVFSTRCPKFSSSLQGAASPACSGMLPAGRVRSLRSFHLSGKSAQARKKCAFHGCLRDVALEFEIYLHFPETAQRVPRVPGCDNSRFPLAKDMFRVKRLPKYLTVVFDPPARSPWLIACPSAVCTDFDPPLLATMTFPSFFKFCAMPMAATALSIYALLSAASTRNVCISSAIRSFIEKRKGSASK